MAFMTNTRGTARTDIPGRLSAFVSAAKIRMDQYRTFRRTLSELSALTDRELADLGINRSMINSIASEAAYGG
ncbi:MAG: DUF1127 domain-containing protein [Rhodobacterales bacterium]|nr:DUF1127 domain-containing protein [Rhodobacterales bacterium]